ncbi:cellulose biosynthesis cyclic di-GMP-binding regulatory protein BcsB [Bacillus infantis]|uniref:Cellulose biosynthesis cyclic di-GMP-binding regulatory protein BcsB n=1 Tax=Bacillus infantis TaxID=324767 RepID=A0A5D4R3F1_9BACI|nr:cellulose biosynthesis cyclic di-GMP-binding regulatory protein BcsB [Bacillus infantis]
MIGVQGTKTPAGDSGRVETPQELAPRRLNSAPRKAKCLERKSTAPI